MPNRDSETNRFQGMPMSELYAACQTRASTLLGLDSGRTTKERANLAADTAHLLLAVAPKLASGEHIPGTPSQAILQGSEDFLPAFLTAHEMVLRQARYQTLVAACDLAYGRDSKQWCRDGTIDGQRVYDLAMGSEEGLAIVLAHLEEVFVANKLRPFRG